MQQAQLDSRGGPSGGGRRTRLLPPIRTLAILLPVHLAAFLFLYFALVHVLENEIVRGQSDSVGVLARAVIEDLHLVMVAAPPPTIQEGLAAFSGGHELLDLELFDAAGKSIPGGSQPPPTVAELLSEGRSAKFRLERAGRGWRFDGELLVTAADRCASCHTPGETLGVATMSYDVTPYVESARSRLRWGIGGLVFVWVGVMGVLSVVTRRVAQRSLARLRADVDRSAERPDLELGEVSKLILDPVSSELYSSLRQVLEAQRDREAHVVSRLEHTHRLASLGQLAAGLAHEIKNPLAGIHGALEILRDETEDGQRKELFEQMLAETSRVNQTMQALLHFARPRRPHMASQDIPRLLEEVAQLLGPGFRKRRVTVACSTAPDLKRFTLDAEQIRQVLVNLVTNAAEAMPDGGHIALRAATLPEGQGILIAVEDNGPGMDPELQERIFEPFFTTKRAGTGLGLAIAKTLVHQHGGDIEVRSQPGQGSTFMILLPGAQAEPEAVDRKED